MASAPASAAAAIVSRASCRLWLWLAETSAMTKTGWPGPTVRLPIVMLRTVRA